MKVNKEERCLRSCLRRPPADRQPVSPVSPVSCNLVELAHVRTPAEESAEKNGDPCEVEMEADANGGRAGEEVRVSERARAL